jgi:23S rRNA pseudouridine2605 synthase
MTERVKRKSAAPAAKRASASAEPAARAKETGANTKKAAAKKKVVTPKPAKAGAANAKSGKGVKAATTKAKPAAQRVKERATKGSEAKAKAATPAAKTRKTKAKTEVSLAGYRVGDPVVDPVGDTTDGEGRTYTGEAEAHATVEMEAFRADTNLEAMDAGLEAGPGRGAARLTKEERARQAAKDAAASTTNTEAVADFAGADEAREPGKLERLQKILSQAGVASRRRAEEMIVAGRVVVNGQVVTTLGSKADAARDHIRVDGKLLHGAERHRYFLLNKPKGFVTTVSDPEGRPTVMQFFTKMPERVYPVGRLDYQSEGLLLMTNDGELANLLTKAGSGVEKTYLVKVAGQPSEAELERLRGGVAIEKSEKGSEHVQTAPARIHQVRHGDNPWYEVVLTEGRNRELRKMFAAIGHFAEKIRRVGYGPLVLDVEPGKMRELSTDEVNALRLTAEGRIKPRRVNLDRVLPKEAGIAAEKRGKFRARPNQAANPRFERPAGQFGRKELGGQKSWGQHDRPRGQGERPLGQGDRPRGQGAARAPKKEWQPREREFRDRGERKPFAGGERRERGERRPFGGGEKRPFGGGERRPFAGGEKRPFGGGERRERGGARFQGGRKPFRGGENSSLRIESVPQGPQAWEDRAGREGKRPFGAKPGFKKPGFSGPPRREGGVGRFDGGRRKPFPPRGERPAFPRSERPQFGRGERPAFERGGEGKPRFEGGKSKGFQTGAKFGGKPGGFGKFRGQGGRDRKPGFSRPGGQRGGWKRG